MADKKKADSPKEWSPAELEAARHAENATPNRPIEPGDTTPGHGGVTDR